MSSQPKVKTKPPYRQPTHSLDPKSFDKQLLRVRFDLLDFTHDLWGWGTLSKEQHLEFLKFVQSVEKQTWAEIKTVGGGKRKGTNHHPLEIAKFDKKAQKRLTELNLYPIVGDSLFSLRMTSLTRIYGARDEEFFRPIWHDPYHDEKNKAAYPLS